MPSYRRLGSASSHALRIEHCMLFKPIETTSTLQHKHKLSMHPLPRCIHDAYCLDLLHSQTTGLIEDVTRLVDADVDVPLSYRIVCTS